MVILFESSDEPRREVDDFLDFLKLTLSGCGPHAQAVSNVRKDIRLNDNFDDVTGEVMTKFAQGHENSVAFLHYSRHMRPPIQPAVNDDAQYLDLLRRSHCRVADFEVEVC